MLYSFTPDGAKGRTYNLW